MLQDAFTILNLPEDILVRIAGLVPLPCGMSRVNITFRDLKLSDYQPVTHRLPTLRRHEKLLTGLRSQLVINGCDKFSRELILRELLKNNSLTCVDLRSNHLGHNGAMHIARAITSPSLTEVLDFCTRESSICRR